MTVLIIVGFIFLQVNCTLGMDAVCVPGISKYASSKGLGFYYECQSGDDSPILKECPDAAIWDRKTMECTKAQVLPLAQRMKREAGQSNEEDESKIFFEPVLGRTVSLGDLYDARRDLPLNGFSLWNENVVEEKKLTKNKLYSNTKFFFEKSQNDRFAKFAIDASLKLSYLGGLVEVEGSAEYVKHQKETSNHVRFNMMYEATTKTETLPMSLRQNLTYPDICGKFLKNPKSGPTHVISSVEYGMKALFMFEKYVESYESEEKIKGDLRVVVKTIPSFEIEGSSKFESSGSLNKVKNTMDVKMFGDFIVKHSPTTFKESVAVYRDLSSYLGDEATGYKKSSPVRMMLTPLDKYCTEAHLVMTGISADLMTKTTEIMLDLGKLMLNVRTLESTYLAHKFLDISDLLKLFRIELDVYTIKYKTKLRDIIPAMRGGGGEEQLPLLLANYTESPFQFDYGKRFLQERERELNTINSLFDDNLIANGDITVGDFTSANIAHALLHKTYVFIYKFSVFSNIEVTEEYLENRTITTDTWYNDYKKIGLAGFNWREFKTFVTLNKDSSEDKDFFIQGTPLVGDKLTQIAVYENGIELTSDFKVPIPPPKPKVISKTYNSVTLLLGKTEDIIKNDFVTELQVKYGTELDSESNYKTVIINTKEYQAWTRGNKTRCRRPCGKKGGPCEQFCGVGGYCCKRGIHECPEGAQKIALKSYSCVTNLADKTGKILTTVEIPLQAEVRKGNASQVVSVTHTFKTAFQTPFGRGRDSEALTSVRPLPSSPPKLEPIHHIASTSIRLKWHKPDVISEHLTLSGYKVDITNVKTVFNTTDQNLVISDLEPATKYTVYLEAWFSDWTIVGEIAEVDFHTIPSQPDKPPAIKIGKHDVTLQLDAKEELAIATDAIFKRYNVIYYKVDENMTEIPGTRYENNFQNNTIEISSLTQGTKYNFEYRIVTSKGASLFSPPQLVVSHYNKTELEEINEEIVKKSDELRNHINTEISIISNQISHLKLAPLGTITAWVMKPTNRSGELATLPSGWQRCDGSIITEPSIWAGLHTPDLNGGRRFLRGGNDKTMLHMEDDTTRIADHSHIDNGHNHKRGYRYENNEEWRNALYTADVCKTKAPKDNSDTYFCERDPRGHNIIKLSDNSIEIITSKSGMGGISNLAEITAPETKPKNMNVIYIIKIFN